MDPALRTVPALVHEQPHTAGQSRVVGQRQAAVARSDVLVLLKAEAGDVADGAQQPALPVLAEPGLCAVLDEDERVPVADRAQRADVRGRAEEMYGDDGLGARGERRLDRARVEVPVAGAYVGEHHARLLGQHRRDRAEVRDGRGDDLVARADSGRRDRQMQGRRARTAGDRFRAGVQPAHLGFEGACFTAEGTAQHRRIHNAQHRGPFLVAEGAAARAENCGQRHFPFGHRGTILSASLRLWPGPKLWPRSAGRQPRPGGLQPVQKYLRTTPEERRPADVSHGRRCRSR